MTDINDKRFDKVPCSQCGAYTYRLAYIADRVACTYCFSKACNKRVEVKNGVFSVDSNEPNAWIAVADGMPDPERTEMRVEAYTPGRPIKDRYRLVAPSLFAMVCSAATYWRYITPPEQESS